MAPASSSPPPSCRHWANLADGPAGLIADRLLAHDVADYIRFRAVCGSWRLCTAEPSAFSGLDRRFLPRQWILLLEPHPAPDRRRFLNLSTGECVQVCLPELLDHVVLAQTCDGLLVLLHHDGTHVRLLNPLTRHLTRLPPLTTLLPQMDHPILYSPTSHPFLGAWGSGVLNDDDSTVVLSFNSLDMLGVAKPGDVGWTLLRTPSELRTTSLMFAGRFYCVNEQGVMVLKNQPWRLEVAAKLHIWFPPIGHTVHLVENAGELMLVHRRFSRNFHSRGKRRYDVYRVDLDTETLCRVKTLGDGGGRALFIGMRCSLSVPIGVFPAGSISGDAIYLRFDMDESVETESSNLADRSTTPAVSYNLDRRLVAQPHTLVDCLSTCSTDRI